MKIKHNTAGTGLSGSNVSQNTSTSSTNVSSTLFNSYNTTFNFNMNGPSSASANFNNNHEVSSMTSFVDPTTAPQPSSNARSTSTASMLARINEDSLSPSFATQIQTRSAASRAAAAAIQYHQNQKLQGTASNVGTSLNSTNCAAVGGGNKSSTTTTDMSSSFKRHTHHSHNNHHQSQHAIGKIVKPIPVRPMSSSSSSSTHSSSFCSATANLILKGHHHANTDNNDSLNGTNNSVCVGGVGNGGNFSLIAKYFASFPATRLKAQSPIPSDGIGIGGCVANSSTSTNVNNSNACSFKPMLETINKTTMTSSQAATPFLPFKKTHISHSSGNNKTTTFNPFSNFTSQNGHSNLGASNSTAITSLGNNINGQVSAQLETDGIQFNLRSSAQHNNNHNTDHLCTNFKRMIKLNDNQAATIHPHQHHFMSNTEDAASPRTAASNTPTGLLDSDSCGEHASSLSNHSNAGGGEQSTNAISNCSSLASVQSSYFSNGSQCFGFNNLLNEKNFANNQNSPTLAATTAPIFGQITMETRSTRKFLIKHHPYLQMNSSHHQQQQQKGFNQLELNKSNNKQQMRPSINLIKMKRMIYTSNHSEANNQRVVASPVSNNKSNRASRSNGETWDSGNNDQKLVKFTDIAPSPGCSSTSQRIKNQLLLASSKRRQSTANTALPTNLTKPVIMPSASVNSTCTNDSVLTKPVNNNIMGSSTTPVFATTSNSATQTNLNKTPQSCYALKTRKSSTSSNSASFAAPTTPNTPYQHLKHLTNNSNNLTSNTTYNPNISCNAQLLGKTENEWSYFLNSSSDNNGVNSFSHEGLCWNEECDDADNAVGDDQQCLDEEDDIDDSQEDSSGYYSSYHSVDLISSSGGSSGGDLIKINQQNSSKALNLNVFGVKHTTIDKDIITQTGVVADSGNGDMTGGQAKSNNQMPPHHHYHTRYLTNILQQNHSQTSTVSNSDLTSHRHRSTTPTVKQNQNISHNNNNNTPTTRLRYQQQLAAAAASANLIKSSNILTNKQQHQLEIDSACDLDLDQIEND